MVYHIFKERYFSANPKSLYVEVEFKKVGEVKATTDKEAFEKAKKLGFAHPILEAYNEIH